MKKKIIITYAGTVFCFLAAAYLIPGQEAGMSKTPGLLSNAHNELAGRENCLKCHIREKKIAAAKCLDCHIELAQRIKAGQGFHRDKTEDCAECHVEHNGADYRLAQWNPADFDHTETGYILGGAHQKIKTCAPCHKPGNSPDRKYSKSFLLIDNRCTACHRDAHRGNQPECGGCHTTTDWSVDIW